MPHDTYVRRLLVTQILVLLCFTSSTAFRITGLEPIALSRSAESSWCEAGCHLPHYQAKICIIPHSHGLGRREQRRGRFQQQRATRVVKLRLGMKDEYPEGLVKEEVYSSLEALQISSGWVEGDEYVFCYGALLSSSVHLRRGVDPVSRPNRKFVPCLVPSRRLSFSLQGGWASIPLCNASNPQEAPAVHGAIIPLSADEIQKLASGEGGYNIERISVTLYDSCGKVEEVEALAFIGSWWRTLPRDIRPTQRYLELIRSGAETRNLNPEYRSWLDSLSPASASDMRAQAQLKTPSQLAATAFLAALSLLLAAFLLLPHISSVPQ